jgi:dTDP-4-amino-4,6-dideoxygalactose transaminase
MTDIEASLGIHQLKKIDTITCLRRQWAARYADQLAGVPALMLPKVSEGSAWHLFVILLDLDQLTVSRDKFIEMLKHENVGAGIHFVLLP